MKRTPQTQRLGLCEAPSFEDYNIYTFLLIWITDQDTLLGFGIQLPLLLLWHMYICNAIEYPQVCEVCLLPEIQLIWRHYSICGSPILPVYCHLDDFGPVEFSHMLLLEHCHDRFLYHWILPFAHTIPFCCIFAGKFTSNSLFLQIARDMAGKILFFAIGPLWRFNACGNNARPQLSLRIKSQKTGNTNVQDDGEERIHSMLTWKTLRGKNHGNLLTANYNYNDVTTMERWGNYLKPTILTTGGGYNT